MPTRSPDAGVVVAGAGRATRREPQPATRNAKARMAAAARMAREMAGRALRPALPGDNRCSLLDRGRDALDLSGLQQQVLRCHFGTDGRRDLRAPLAVADAVLGRAEDDVGAALQRAGLPGADRRVDRHVDLLEGAGHDVRAQVALVGVDADAEVTFPLRGV